MVKNLAVQIRSSYQEGCGVVISSSSVVPADRDDASGWKGGRISFSVAALNRESFSARDDDRLNIKY